MDSDSPYQVYLGKVTDHRGTKRRNSALASWCAAFMCRFTCIWVSEFLTWSTPKWHSRTEEEDISKSLISAAGPDPSKRGPTELQSPNAEG